MNTINKVALCNNLNMNFDEASELFSEESLQSMQMAKISGGAEWWDNFCSWVRKLFKNATVTPYFENGTIGIKGSFIIGATNRPTDEGIVYGNNTISLTHDGCSAQFSLNSKGEYSMVSMGYSGEDITTPTA